MTLALAADDSRIRRSEYLLLPLVATFTMVTSAARDVIFLRFFPVGAGTDAFYVSSGLAIAVSNFGVGVFTPLLIRELTRSREGEHADHHALKLATIAGSALLSIALLAAGLGLYVSVAWGLAAASYSRLAIFLSLAAPLPCAAGLVAVFEASFLTKRRNAVNAFSRFIAAAVVVVGVVVAGLFSKMEFAVLSIWVGYLVRGAVLVALDRSLIADLAEIRFGKGLGKRMRDHLARVRHMAWSESAWLIGSVFERAVGSAQAVGLFTAYQFATSIAAVPSVIVTGPLMQIVQVGQTARFVRSGRTGRENRVVGRLLCLGGVASVCVVLFIAAIPAKLVHLIYPGDPSLLLRNLMILVVVTGVLPAYMYAKQQLLAWHATQNIVRGYYIGLTVQVVIISAISLIHWTTALAMGLLASRLASIAYFLWILRKEGADHELLEVGSELLK